MEPSPGMFLLPFMAAATPFIILFSIFCGCFLIDFVIQIFICWSLSKTLKRLPPEFQKQNPANVWLLLIPVVRQVFNFFVYPKITESYKAYYLAQAGPEGVGGNPALKSIINGIETCESLTWAYCICAAIMVLPIPHIMACVYLPILVFNIIVVMKLSYLRVHLLTSPAAFPVR